MTASYMSEIWKALRIFGLCFNLQIPVYSQQELARRLYKIL